MAALTRARDPKTRSLHGIGILPRWRLKLSKPRRPAPPQTCALPSTTENRRSPRLRSLEHFVTALRSRPARLERLTILLPTVQPVVRTPMRLLGVPKMPRARKTARRAQRTTTRVKTMSHGRKTMSRAQETTRPVLKTTLVRKITLRVLPSIPTTFHRTRAPSPLTQGTLDRTRNFNNSRKSSTTSRKKNTRNSNKGRIKSTSGCRSRARTKLDSNRWSRSTSNRHNKWNKGTQSSSHAGSLRLRPPKIARLAVPRKKNTRRHECRSPGGFHPHEPELLAEEAAVAHSFICKLWREVAQPARSRAASTSDRTIAATLFTRTVR